LPKARLPIRRRRAGAALAPSISIPSKRRDRGKRAVRPSDDQREERSVNALLGGVLVWGFKEKAQWCSLGSFWFLCFYSSWPTFLPPALPRTAGPRKAFIFSSNAAIY